MNDQFHIGTLDVLVLIIALIPKTETDRNTLTRPGVGEESVNVSINLNKDGSEKTYSLELSPREYSSEEFKEMAGKMGRGRHIQGRRRRG